MNAIKRLSYNDPGSNKNYAWVRNDFITQSETLEEAMKEWAWELILDDNGNVDDIDFIGEKIGDDLILFEAIAPYIEKDSYIEMYGEDGYRWRWIFDGEKCKEIYPETIWRD